MAAMSGISQSLIGKGTSPASTFARSRGISRVIAAALPDPQAA
jgi:hypothetical protein